MDAPLFELAQHLDLHGYNVTRAEDHIIVRHPGGELALSIRCAPRASDSGRLWFVADAGTPIAEAEQVINAAMVIKGHLSSGQS